jgi:uncharacterized protein
MSTRDARTDIAGNKTSSGIHLMAKPAGPACNLNCTYCFYLEKKALFGMAEKYRMPDAVLKDYTEKYICFQPTPLVEFVWQGGEPTLLGIDFFKRAIELQKTYAHLKTITNSLQTNGTLLTDEWCSFLKKNKFMVGISLDGPRHIHDLYRRDRGGKGTFDAVMRGLRLLQKHKVDYNVLACVGRETAMHPLEVYRFFRGEGVEFIQFTPVVERAPDDQSRTLGLRLAPPAALDRLGGTTEVTPWTVEPESYGDFLIGVFEEWGHNDVGKVFVMNFEWALNAWVGNPSPVCIHAEQCGSSLVIEHNGDVYACDHCVYPRFRLGNILADTMAGMLGRSGRCSLGATKDTALPRYCRECEVLAACRGGCPKHRFAQSYYDEPGLHYLCPGYRKFFLHIRKYLRVMAQLLENDLSPSLVMEALKGPLVITRGKPGPGKNNLVIK